VADPSRRSGAVRPASVAGFLVLALLLGLTMSGSGAGGAVAGVRLWKAPTDVDALVVAHPELHVLAEQPGFSWIGETTDPRTVGSWVQAAAGLPVPLVLYAIPGRDLGGHSAGGFPDEAGYLAWVGAVAHHLGDAPALVVVEPDALGLSLQLPPAERAARLAAIGRAVDVLKANSPRTRVYLDASMWVSPAAMAGLLERANVGSADGFSINVANHVADGPALEYGNELSAMTGGKHFLVDSSRNGRGSSSHERDWCNVRGLALGRLPGTLLREEPRLDGFFWIKTPGRSDGTCNGGPPAGRFWLSNALELVANRRS
jgi:endoglucanase